MPVQLSSNNENECSLGQKVSTEISVDVNNNVSKESPEVRIDKNSVGKDLFPVETSANNENKSRLGQKVSTEKTRKDAVAGTSKHFDIGSVFLEKPVEHSTWKGRYEGSFLNAVDIKAKSSKRKVPNILLQNSNQYFLEGYGMILVESTCSFNSSYFMLKIATTINGSIDSAIKSCGDKDMTEIMLTEDKQLIYSFRSSFFLKLLIREKRKVTNPLNCFFASDLVLQRFLEKLDLVNSYCGCSLISNVINVTNQSSDMWSASMSCDGSNQSRHKFYFLHLGETTNQSDIEKPVRYQLKKIPKTIELNGVIYHLLSMIASTLLKGKEHYFTVSVSQTSNKFVLWDDANSAPRNVAENLSYSLYFLLYAK